jgi:hypothetical protein
MLIIREEQIQHFIAADDEQLIKVIAAAIRQINEKRVAGYDDEKLAKMIETGIARARSRELVKAEDIAAFVALMFEIAPKFDEQTEIQAVLEDATFPPDERFYQLFERVSHQGWYEAETLYDDTFWFPTDSAQKG